MWCLLIFRDPYWAVLFLGDGGMITEQAAPCVSIGVSNLYFHSAFVFPFSGFFLHFFLRHLDIQTKLRFLRGSKIGSVSPI